MSTLKRLADWLLLVAVVALIVALALGAPRDSSWYSTEYEVVR